MMINSYIQPQFLMNQLPKKKTWQNSMVHGISIYITKLNRVYTPTDILEITILYGSSSDLVILNFGKILIYFGLTGKHCDFMRYIGDL